MTRQTELNALERYKRGLGIAPVIYKAGYMLKAQEGATMTFVASEETPDRVGDVISISGWDGTAGIAPLAPPRPHRY